ncbi:helix-turn-helix domain-containing protein [Syntrophomonas wolfei]|jgi:transcriptional regulator with XRE-family HTH domain|uniref:helix-turn-helix domain-containing protein n=1 Tax=Syntrophomonas wolfei TaxID=863 RepID=UPI0023F1BB8D|nr:helix-turn-helix transcriptional regulator [Syntrophomonas wolfei]
MIGDRIKELREKQGLTQKQLSEDPCLDLNINTLASYERNLREPKIDMIIKLARYFGVTTDYLLGASEYETAENDFISRQIPLSDKTIDFLKSCPPELQPILDLLLSDPNLEDFLIEVMTYIYSLKYDESSESVDIISDKLNQAGSSFAPPEIIGRLLPRLQLLKVINALERLLSSMEEAKHVKEDPGISK